MTEVDLYHIRSFVPDFDAIATEIAARSARISATAAIWSACHYGPGRRETVDIMLPQRLISGAPVHIFIHGGYWRSGERAAYRCVAEPVLAVGGIAAIVEYDLMPGTRLEAIVGQVRRAANWIAAQAAGLGADARRLTVSGHSAGAHLASYLAATGPTESSVVVPEIQGMLLLSGIYELSGIPDSFLRHEAQMTQAEARAWSPLSSVHHGGPHRIIAVGKDETPPFHDQAARLHTRLRVAGMGSELLTLPGLNHMNIVLDLADSTRPLGQRLAALVADTVAA